MELNIREAFEDSSAITEKCKTILSKYDIPLEEQIEEQRYFDLFKIVTKIYFKYADVKYPNNIKYNALMLTKLFKEANDIKVSGFVKGAGVKKYKIEKGLQDLLWLFLNDYVIKAYNYYCDYKWSEEHKAYSLKVCISPESNKLNSEGKEYQRNYFSSNLDNKSYILDDYILNLLIENESSQIGKVKSLAGKGDKFIPLYGWAAEQIQEKLPELESLNKTQKFCLIGDILDANHCFCDGMSEKWKLASDDEKMHIIDNCYKSYKNALEKNKKACKGK